MELLQLKYFCSAAETENFTKTAEKYLVPASNISQTVSRLEKELDVRLFDRSANKILLNEQGKEFYKRVKKGLDFIDEAKKFLEDKNVSGEVRINVCTNRRVVTEVIEKFKRIYPDVTFTMSHDHKSDGSFDIIVSDDILKNKELARHTLIKENIILAAQTGSAALKSKTIAELSNERFITMPKGSSQYLLTKKLCENAGFLPNIAIQSDDPYYIRKYVSMGLGIAFIPDVSWKGQFDDNVSYSDVCRFIRTTYVFWNGERYMSKAADEFLKLLITECSIYN